jgi:hypothetical protein
LIPDAAAALVPCISFRPLWETGNGVPQWGSGDRYIAIHRCRVATKAFERVMGNSSARFETQQWPSAESLRHDNKQSGGINDVACISYHRAPLVNCAAKCAGNDRPGGAGLTMVDSCGGHGRQGDWRGYDGLCSNLGRYEMPLRKCEAVLNQYPPVCAIVAVRHDSRTAKLPVPVARSGRRRQQRRQ